MLLIYWSLHQLLVQLMRSLHPEQGWEEYPRPGSACCPCQAAPMVLNTGQIHTKTSPCHLCTLEHPLQKCSSRDRSAVSGQREMGTDPVPNPTSLKGRDLFLTLCPAHGEDKGRCGTCSQGKFYLWKNHKTSKGWKLLQQSHTSLPEVTTEQRSFALIGDLWLCPKRVPLGTPRLALLLW